MCYSNCNGMYCIVHHDMYNSTVYHMRCRSSHKCSVLHVENKNNNSVYHLWSPYVIGRPYIFLPCSSYNVNNVQLIDNTATVDLGVIIDGKLRFDKHIANIVSNAHSRAVLIRCCFKSRDSCLLFRAFTEFVRPLLEYCSPVWNPHYHCDIEKIESVQRRFTKYIGGFKNLSHREHLLRLNAETLELRRLKSDLTLTYRTVYGYCGLKFASFLHCLII